MPVVTQAVTRTLTLSNNRLAHREKSVKTNGSDGLERIYFSQSVQWYKMTVVLNHMPTTKATTTTTKIL